MLFLFFLTIARLTDSHRLFPEPLIILLEKHWNMKLWMRMTKISKIWMRRMMRKPLKKKCVQLFMF